MVELLCRLQANTHYEEIDLHNNRVFIVRNMDLCLFARCVLFAGAAVVKVGECEL